MKVQKSTRRQKHCRYMPNAQSRENYFHCCHNKSSLKGGMHSNTAVAHDSPWNCLSQRLSQIGLIPHDVGGSGDCFFKSVSHQLYGNADQHVEIRMAGISHLHNHPELYIESISDDSWENYIRQMSLPGTWCDHLIIQAVANALNCVIHIIDSNANSQQATIITPVLQQGTQQAIFIGYINHLHYVSTVTRTNNQNISRLQCVKRKYVSEYNKDNDLPKRITNSKNQLSEGAAEKKQERLAKKRANSKNQLSEETAEKRQERLAKKRANSKKQLSRETAEKRQERLSKMRANNKKQLSQETTEKRQERLAKIRANQKKQLSTETAERRQERLAKRRANYKKQSSQQSAKEREERLIDFPIHEQTEAKHNITNNQNISRLQCAKRKYVSEYNKDNDLPKRIANSKNQLSEGAAEKKQERLAKKELIVKTNCLRKLLKKGKNDLQKREPIVKSNCLEKRPKKGRNDFQK